MAEKSYKDVLNFYLTSTSSDGYTSVTYLVPEYCDSLMRKMIVDSIHRPGELDGYVAASVRRTGFLWRKREWIMVLDCDSPDDLLSARSELDSRGIWHYEIESSPSRFWVVCDFVGTLDRVVDEMETIPGVDSNFIGCCRNNGIKLRGCPKDGLLPRFSYPLPSKEWRVGCNGFIHMLHQYWTDGKMKLVAKNVMASKPKPVGIPVSPAFVFAPPPPSIEENLDVLVDSMMEVKPDSL